MVIAAVARRMGVLVIVNRNEVVTARDVAAELGRDNLSDAALYRRPAVAEQRLWRQSNS